MTEVFFSFDTEDYVNPIGADGVLRSAELLRSVGIQGCFCVVARTAEAFVKWGRADVIEALRHHEISTHSYAHSYHPTINEYTDIADFEEAMTRFLTLEEKAVQILREIFGIQQVPAACPPGDSVSYVAHYGYAKMGIPVYTGDLFVDPVRGRHLVNCNITSLGYHTCLDDFLAFSTKEEIDAHLEEIASTKVLHVFYHHPQRAMLAEFWDMVNFNGENTPEEAWKLCRQLPCDHTERFYENFAYMVEKIKADPRFHVTTYREFAENHCGQKREILPEQIPALKQQLTERFFPVTVPDSYCIADMLLACRDFLMGEKIHECGQVYGFLDTPESTGKAILVTAEQMRASAASIGDGFLPAAISVGGYEVNPAQWLFGAMEVISGKTEVELLPVNWQIDMDQFPATKDQDLNGSWVHSKEFRDEYLSHRFRLQSWTFRLPKDTPRFIFE